MENKPLDRSLILPLALGGVSVLGIILVLLAARVAASATRSDQKTPTATPLKYQFLATEPGVVTLIPTEISSPTAEEVVIEQTDTATPEFVTFETATLISSIPTVTQISNPSTATQTAILLPSGAIYDDTDFTLAYTGDWLLQQTVNDVYKNTLHLSNKIGSAVVFTFTGQKVRIAYQSGPGLGIVAIKIDSVDFALDQSNTDTQISEWESPILALTSHTVTVTHVSGGAINIDLFAVIDISTPTPTITPTP